MAASPGYFSCDGCGVPASPEHIAQRVRRLELATRYRPIHIDVLFVALAPPSSTDDDFYGRPKSKEFFTPFLEALGITSSSGQEAETPDTATVDAAHLVEFRRRGLYLAYLSECPLAETAEPVAATISRLAPTLIRRIRFNYKPKHVAPLGSELAPLIPALRAAGVDSVLTLENGAPIPVPRAGDLASSELFQSVLVSLWRGADPSGGYDRIQATKTERSTKAGGCS